MRSNAISMSSARKPGFMSSSSKMSYSESRNNVHEDVVMIVSNRVSYPNAAASPKNYPRPISTHESSASMISSCDRKCGMSFSDTAAFPRVMKYISLTSSPSL